MFIKFPSSLVFEISILHIMVNTAFVKYGQKPGKIFKLFDKNQGVGRQALKRAINSVSST
jgi:hypothetical protein